MGDRTTRAAKGALTGVGQLGLKIGVEVILAPVVLRAAGQETLGAYAALIQAIAYLALVDLGFTFALNRYLCQSFGVEDGMRTFGRVLTTGRTFLLVSNCAFGVLAILFSFYVGRLLGLNGTVDLEARRGLYLLAVWAVMRTPLSLYGSALMATQEMAANNLLAIAGIVVRLATSVVSLALRAGLTGLMLGYVCGELATFWFQRLYFSKLFPAVRVNWGFPDPGGFREMFRFGLEVMKINIATALVLYTDNIVVANLRGAAAASIFYTTQMPALALSAVAQKMADNAGPAINELVARGALPRLRSAYSRLCRCTLLLAVPLSLAVWTFNYSVVVLWVGGLQYGGNLMTVALGIYICCTIMNHLNGLFLSALGDIEWLAKLAMLAGFCHVVVAIGLGSRAGLAGVAWAGCAVEACAFLPLARRTLSQLELSPGHVWREAFTPVVWAMTVVVPVVCVIILVHREPGWVSTFCYLGLFGMAWMAGGMLLGLEVPERRRIWGLAIGRGREGPET